MDYPALIALQTEDTDPEDPRYKVYYHPQGAARLQLLDELEQQIENNSHSRLPDKGYHDGLRIVDDDVTLNEVGDSLDYADTDALYVVTPHEVHTYASVPLDCDVISPWAYGINAEVYEPEDTSSSPTAIVKGADPITTINYETFQPEAPTEGLEREVFDHLHMVAICQSQDIIREAEMTSEEKGKEMGETYYSVVQTTAGYGVRFEFIDPTHALDYVDNSGLFVRLNSDNNESSLERFDKIMFQVADLRTNLAAELWNFKQSPEGRNEEEHQRAVEERSDKSAIDILYAVADEYGRDIAPFISEPYGELLRTETNSVASEFTLRNPLTIE